MTTIVGGICPRCGQFHDLFLAVDGSVVCRNADGTAERIRQLENERDTARAEAASFSAEIDRMVRELSAIRMEHEAEVAALREQIAAAIARGTFTTTGDT